MAYQEETENLNCKSCKWYDDFTGACYSGESENRAEFMDGEDGCDEWEAKE